MLLSLIFIKVIKYHYKGCSLNALEKYNESTKIFD